MKLAPTKDLKLAQHCVYPCLGEILFNDYLPSISDSWTTLKIPLECFAKKGMNYSVLNTVFLFFTEGKMEFNLGNVRIVPKGVDTMADALKCK